jgi:hypothetical protein
LLQAAASGAPLLASELENLDTDLLDSRLPRTFLLSSTSLLALATALYRKLQALQTSIDYLDLPTNSPPASCITMASAIKSALPSHLKPGNGKDDQEASFERRHGKTRSHMASTHSLL